MLKEKPRSVFEGKSISLLSGHINPSKWHTREWSYIQHPYNWEMSISLIWWVHVERVTIKNGHNHSVYEGLSSTWTWKLCNSAVWHRITTVFSSFAQVWRGWVLKVNGGLRVFTKAHIARTLGIFTWMFLTEKCKLHSNFNVMQTTVSLPRLKMLSL